jgi:hypothetical protein
MLSGFMPQQNQPQAPGVPPRVDQSGGKRVPKRSWQDKAYIIGAGLRDAGGGQGNLDAAAAMFGKRDQQAQALEQRQMLDQEARAVITDPREWAVYQANPEAWAKENATRYAAATMGQGTTRVYGDPTAGGSAYTAPTFDFQGDQAVQYGPDGFSILGTRNPTFDEQTGRMNADTGRMNAERPMAVGDGGEVIDPRTGRVIYRNQKNYAPPRVSGSRGRPAPAAAGTSPAMTAIEAELRRRKLIP